VSPLDEPLTTDSWIAFQVTPGRAMARVVHYGQNNSEVLQRVLAFEEISKRSYRRINCPPANAMART
jgi:hypothetical protein